MKHNANLFILLAVAVLSASCVRSLPLGILVKQANKELQSLPDTTMRAELQLNDNYLQLNIFDKFESDEIQLMSLVKSLAKTVILEEADDFLKSEALRTLLSKCVKEDKGLKLVLVASDDSETTCVLSFTPEELEDMLVTVD